MLCNVRTLVVQHQLCYGAHYIAIQLAVLEHQLYVQGVAWDPIGCYLATMSSDK